MLFNSYEFIFLFLLPVFVIFINIKNYELKIWFLIVASIIFYSQWDFVHLIILLMSVSINYYLIKKIVEYNAYKKSFLIIGIILNLLPLIYFKYSNFFNLNDENITLPLAISFFTFQQIAFWVDFYRRKIIIESVKEYAIFVLFFPQLVAGPIVHYNEIIPQIKEKFCKEIPKTYIYTGVLLFCMGLFKKVVLADNFTIYSDNAFSNINNLSSYDAWLGIFAYTFQIYFDFSGYADMALGLALFFGIKLPINFNSPYKARNISEFWRNWHITLSNFLRDYIYIPLGGNKYGYSRQSTNLLITMVIGGFWHGAGWTFILWGFIHGLLLGVSHFFKVVLKKETILPKGIAIIITFLCVSLLWVLFRANSFDDAIEFYKALFSFNIYLNFAFSGVINFLYSEEFLIVIGFIIIWFMPNSLEVSNFREEKQLFSYKKIVFISVLFFIALKSMADKAAVSFVYFNF